MASEQGGSRRGGRAVGTPNRDKAELRALLQERVHEYTELRNRQDEEDGLPPDQRQPIVDDYDPVVALAITSVDRKTPLDARIRCNAEVAQYVRPKLKSVEVTTDPEAMETIQQRQALSERLVNLLEAAAGATKPERAAKPQPPPAEPSE